MANKTFQGRIVQKHDTKANWDKATNFVPLKGEIIVYDDLKKIKIGDGITKVGNLAFINDLDTLAEVAATGSYDDLIDKPTIGDGEVNISYRNSFGGTTSSRFTLNGTGRHNINIYTPTKLSEFTNDTNYATQNELTNATAGLTGAMHFIGTSTKAITEGGTEKPIIDDKEITALSAGDVVLYNHLEFVWDGAKWEQLGDEGSYVLKTQKINGKGLSGDIILNAADVNALSTDSEFIVNLTQDSDGYYNPDKTFEETKAAIDANKKVYFYYSGAYIPVSFMRTSGPEIEIYASSFTIDSRGGFLGSFYWTPANGFVEYYNNIVQEIDSSDTNEMIPTSKAVINYLDQEFNTVAKTMQKTSNLVNTINSTSTTSTYPSAKAVYDFVQNNSTSATIITWSNDET